MVDFSDETLEKLHNVGRDYNAVSPIVWAARDLHKHLGRLGKALARKGANSEATQKHAGAVQYYAAEMHIALEQFYGHLGSDALAAVEGKINAIIEQRFLNKAALLSAFDALGPNMIGAKKPGGTNGQG